MLVVVVVVAGEGRGDDDDAVAEEGVVGVRSGRLELRRGGGRGFAGSSAADIGSGDASSRPIGGGGGGGEGFAVAARGERERRRRGGGGGHEAMRDWRRGDAGGGSDGGERL